MPKRGPNTDAGKAIVRLNALTHGLFASDPVVPGVDDPQVWQHFHDSLIAGYDPVGAVEEMHAERVVALWWRLRRLDNHEAEIIAASIERVTHDFATHDMRDFWAGKPRSLAEANDNLRRSRALVTLLDDLPGMPRGELIDEELVESLFNLLERMEYDYSAEFSSPSTDDGEPVTAGWNCILLTHALAEFDAAHPGAVARIVGRAREQASEHDDEVRYVIEEQDRMRRERRLPGAADMHQLMKYETGLSRKLVQFQHELEALQARRKGLHAPLARVDVHTFAG